MTLSRELDPWLAHFQLTLMLKRLRIDSYRTFEEKSEDSYEEESLTLHIFSSLVTCTE